jgi:hypothetical protein
MTEDNRSKPQRTATSVAQRTVESRNLNIRVDNSRVAEGAKRLNLDDFKDSVARFKARYVRRDQD